MKYFPKDLPRPLQVDIIMEVDNVQVIGNQNVIARVGGAKSPVLLLAAHNECIPLSTDSNIPLSRRIPSVAIGMARGGDCHRAGEFLEISSIALGLKQLILFVLSISSLNAPSRSPKGGGNND